MTGGLLILSAYGAQDIYLTGNPQISFFKQVFKRYSNFSFVSMPQYFIGNADFGQTIYLTVDRIADLIHQVFIKFELPSLEPYSFIDENGELVKFYWVNGIGNAIIKLINIEIGGNVIDEMSGLYMDILNQFIVPAGKKNAYNEMIGKSESNINPRNNGGLDLYVPLPFWFCQNVGCSLPLIALQQNEVRFNVTFRQLSELVISSDGKSKLPQNNTITLTRANMDIDYIFLEDFERKMFAKDNHQYLIRQTQTQCYGLTSNGLRQDPVNPMKMERITDTFQRIDMDFNHLVIEMFWIIQNSTVLSNGKNEWFNYSSEPYDENGIMIGGDPLVDAKYQLEGQDLMDYKPNIYYRTVVPYQRHSYVPNDYIYNYSFSLNPESSQPSGTCNFSRIDNANLLLHINADLIDPILTIFAVNYNILNISAGMAGVEYAT